MAYRYEDAVEEAGRRFIRGMVWTVVALFVLALAILTVGCGLTGGDLWNAATNVVSQADGGTTTAPDSTEQPTETTTVPPVAPHVEPVTAAYKITRVTASMIFWTGPDLTWPERDGCCGESHLYRADGKGGKFDHVRRNSKSRDWKNIHNGYGAWRQWGEPAQGEACELWACNYAHTEWVKIGEFKWVR